MADGNGDVVPATIRSSRSRSGAGSIFPGGSSESNLGIELHTLGEPAIRLVISEGARRP
jgi:hypothetical protein